jgi:Ni,Fe-hydrogenase maturation factor
MPKKQTIYIFGNELLDFDNLPIKLAPKLKKLFPGINFIIQDPTENIKPAYAKASAGKPPRDGELIIIDTVMGIKKVTVINEIEKLETEKIYSMHDFDLAFNLKLLKKIGRLKKLAIFGVPPVYDKNITLNELSKLIKNYIKINLDSGLILKSKKGFS